MDEITREHFKTLNSNDPDVRYASFQYIISLTDNPVDWAYAVWDDLLAMLHSKDNHQRSIAAQLLSSLAKSDPQKRMLQDLEQLMAVTKDERFVTARHSLQSLWKVAIAGEDLKKLVVDQLSKRFIECRSEKNGTLIRYDILEVFKKIYDHSGDLKLRDKASALIEKEEDPKYKKKYAGLWKEFLNENKQKKL